MSDVLAFDSSRTTNADLIVDAAKLGWLDGHVFDATYGDGGFWTKHQPEQLSTNDLHKPADLDWDYRNWPDMPIRFDTVVFDPPYKLQGTPSKAREQMNERYDVHKPRTAAVVLAELMTGAVNCAQLVKPGGLLLVKCMDQVVSGRVYRQTTDYVIPTIERLPGWRWESWLHLVHNPQPQRSQTKPRNNYSTLLAFKKNRNAS